MVDREVGDSVVLDDGSKAVVVTENGQSSDDNGESEIGEKDLVAVASVEEEGARIEVCEDGEPSASRFARMRRESKTHGWSTWGRTPVQRRS